MLIGAVYTIKPTPIRANGGTFRPVPEFARTEKVALSASLFEFNYRATQLAGAIKAAGASVEIVGSGNQSTAEALPASVVTDHSNIWIRDFSPIPVTKSGKIIFTGFASNSPDQENKFFGETLTRQLGRPYRAATFELEGGNFLTDGNKCYIAGKLEESKNDASPVPSITEMQKGLGCTDLIVISKPPHVHIDMFAKILGPNLVAVNVLDESLLEFYRDSDGEVPEELVELNEALDRSADQFSKHLNVVRLPMPAPYKNTFRTYANAILVNQTAIIPDYEQYGWNYGPYPDTQLLPELREKVKKIYSEAGFNPVFINADGLIYNGGAFHCVTMHLPSPTLTISKN